MNTTPSTPSSSSSPTRALVIAGGGAAGNAWALGVIAGLAEAGIDVTDADLIVGTSSGSTVAAQITSGTGPAALYAAILAEAPRPQAGATDATGTTDATGRAGSAGGAGSAGATGSAGRVAPRVSGQNYLDWSNGIIASAEDAAAMRRAMGAAALATDSSDGVSATRWRDIVASRLPGAQWPEQRVLIAAVDAHTGEPVVFDRDSGVDLVDAVAASTSAMTPYRIGDGRYINGGYRRNENADLAAGFGVVLVLSPFSGRTRYPLDWGMQLAAQVDELRAGGSRVDTVFPDAGAGDVFDANALDPSTRRQAARGGYDQGRSLAERISDAWR